MMDPVQEDSNTSREAIQVLSVMKDTTKNVLQGFYNKPASRCSDDSKREPRQMDVNTSRKDL